MHWPQRRCVGSETCCSASGVRIEVRYGLGCQIASPPTPRGDGPGRAGVDRPYEPSESGSRAPPPFIAQRRWRVSRAWRWLGRSQFLPTDYHPISAFVAGLSGFCCALDGLANTPPQNYGSAGRRCARGSGDPLTRLICDRDSEDHTGQVGAVAKRQLLTVERQPPSRPLAPLLSLAAHRYLLK